MKLAIVVVTLSLAACGTREPESAPASAAEAEAAPAPAAQVEAAGLATRAPAPPTTGAMPVPTDTFADVPHAAPELTPIERAQVELNAAAGSGVGLALSRSTDEQAHAYAALLAHVTGAMFASNPDACARLLLPQKFGPVGWDEFPAQYQRPMMDLQQQLFARARAQPNPAPSEEEAGPLFDVIHDRLAAQHGSDALKGVEGELGAAPLCRAWHLYYTGIAAAPPAQGGRVMRWLNAP